MDTALELMNRYKSEDTNSLENIDHSEKPNIVASLEDFTDDDRVMHFLLAAVCDEQEYDLARIEILKVFDVKCFRDLTVRRNLGRAIATVLRKSEEILVRNYAAMAAAQYMDLEEVSDTVAHILLDENEDFDLRWNAFAAIKSDGPSQRSIELLSRLRLEQEFEKSSERVLSEWNVH